MSASVNGCVYGHRRPTCRDNFVEVELADDRLDGGGGRGDPAGKHAADLSAECDHIPRLDWTTGAGLLDPWASRGAFGVVAERPSAAALDRWSCWPHTRSRPSVTMCVHRSHERMDEPGVTPWVRARDRDVNRPGSGGGADHDVRYSITVRETKQVTAAIAGIDDTAWVDIAYPDGGTAQVAETTMADRRLIVRRSGWSARRRSCGPTGATTRSSPTAPAPPSHSTPITAITRCANWLSVISNSVPDWSTASRGCSPPTPRGPCSPRWRTTCGAGPPRSVASSPARSWPRPRRCGGAT